MNERTGGQWARERMESRAAKYDIAVRLGSSPVRADRDTAAQARHYAEAVGEMRALELRAREVLMRHGVPLNWFCRYYNFVRHLVRVRRLGGNVGIAAALPYELARWTTRGCEHGLLLEIVEQVFSVKLALASGAETGVELVESGGDEIRRQKSEGRMQSDGEEEECGGEPQAGSRKGRPGCPDEDMPAGHG